MKSININSSTEVQRKHSALAALASVAAEGLTPTAATKKRLDLYVKGKISSDELYQKTLAGIKAKNKQPVK